MPRSHLAFVPRAARRVARRRVHPGAGGWPSAGPGGDAGVPEKGRVHQQLYPVRGLAGAEVCPAGFAVCHRRFWDGQHQQPAPGIDPGPADQGTPSGGQALAQQGRVTCLSRAVHQPLGVRPAGADPRRGTARERPHRRRVRHLSRQGRRHQFCEHRRPGAVSDQYRSRRPRKANGQLEAAPAYRSVGQEFVRRNTLSCAPGRLLTEIRVGLERVAVRLEDRSPCCWSMLAAVATEKPSSAHASSSRRAVADRTTPRADRAGRLETELERRAERCPRRDRRRRIGELVPAVGDLATQASRRGCHRAERAHDRDDDERHDPGSDSPPHLLADRGAVHRLAQGDAHDRHQNQYDQDHHAERMAGVILRGERTWLPARPWWVRNQTLSTAAPARRSAALRSRAGAVAPRSARRRRRPPRPRRRNANRRARAPRSGASARAPPEPRGGGCRRAGPRAIGSTGSPSPRRARSRSSTRTGPEGGRTGCRGRAREGNTLTSSDQAQSVTDHNASAPSTVAQPCAQGRASMITPANTER